MDTNTIAVLIKALANQPQAATNDLTILIVGMILTSVGTIVSSVLAYLARSDTNTTKNEVVKTADTVRQIEVHTNGERSHTMEVMAQLRDEITAVSRRNATLEEAARGVEAARTVKEAVESK